MAAADPVVVEESAALSEGYLAPHCRASGEVRSAMFHPQGYSLWKLNAELGDGAELTWGTEHGDEGIIVLSGELSCEGQSCKPDGGIVVEAGVETTIMALTDSTILHFGPVLPVGPVGGPLGPANTEGRSFHLVNAEPEKILVGVLFYSDGTCDTCRTSLFSVDRRQSTDSYSSPSHTHSEDEIIHVLDGEIAVGPLKVGAGQAVAIPGDRRYSYRADGSYRFINYRADMSYMVTKPGSEPYVETLASLVAQTQQTTPFWEQSR